METDVQPDNVASISGTTESTAIDDNQPDVLPANDNGQQDLYNGGGYYTTGIRRRRRKRPCIPIYGGGHGHFKDDDGSTRNDANNERFFYDYTVINNHYDFNAPAYPPQQYHQQNYAQKPVYNSYGGYTCIPNYGHGGLFANRPHRPHRPNHHGGGQGGYGGGGGYNRPQGGPLGFFGPGGLFDFSQSGSSGGSGDSGSGTSPLVGVLSDTVSEDDIKPVWEINVPDTINAVITNL